MITATKTAKATKTVSVITRYEIKRNAHVVYTVRSSKGAATTYTTTLVDGHATGCSCPALKPCYHMVQLEAKEATRREAAETARCNRDLAYSEF